ncbi:MAG TPA: hypothetical protein VFE47_18740 [Tepidisphaeraceae bacterium]|jgi:predicted transcriptional regulator|nr:hypothetical protein [Tepidisphaeraceae bacterium]
MLTIELDGQLEDRLKQAAESEGDDPQALARRVLEENLPTGQDDQYRRGYEQIPEDISDVEALIAHLPLPTEQW